MKIFFKKYGKYFWVLPLIFAVDEWYRILIVGNGDILTGIMIGGFTYYFWGVGTGRIVDKDIKPFEDSEEEE
jgi:hypothetical protein